MERNHKPGGVIACLSLCFLIGAGAGQALAFGFPDTVTPTLRRTLIDYYRNPELSQINVSLTLTTLATWFRLPVLVFLWGFTSLGVPLVCLTVTAFGFLLSFSVGCFAAAFGWTGVPLSAAALGIRTAITLPCFFLLSLSSIERARWLHRLSIGKRGVRPDRRACVILCTLVLLAGAALDLYGTPRLLRFTLDWFATSAP